MTTFRVLLDADVSLNSMGIAIRPLNVPFEENQMAQKLGARWNKSGGFWYVPPQFDMAPFWRWTSRDQEVRIRHLGYSVAGAHIQCHRCKQLTTVYALFLPSGYQHRSPSAASGWRQSTVGALLSYVTDLQPDIAREIMAIAPGFHLDASQGKKLTYWMNHCASCGTRIGDHHLHAKDKAPFQGKHQVGDSTVDTLVTRPLLLECKADVSYSGETGFYDFLEELHGIPSP